MAKINLDKKNIPQHIGIIMDGNRRWAEKRRLTVEEGHRAGAQNLEKIIDHCLELGVKTLTVYALSTENWRERTKKEVKGIFDLILQAAKEKKKDYEAKGIKLAVLGEFQAFPRKVANAIREILKIVKTHERLKVNLALNYGSRDEILKAVKKIIQEKIPSRKLDEKTFSHFLYTNGEPDPDLIIRTAGEVRVSNFLLWQMSYSELYFTDTLWPDFDEKELDKAIVDYQKRQRRFGK
ncbi:polyprenyl diphosphate synthase [Patescibacteria group bacterium]|nr:polyprenyl diphosphate synthase [Patescibacteria group bacterium]